MAERIERFGANEEGNRRLTTSIGVRKSGGAVTLALWGLLVTSATRGQNVLPNAGFNTGISGWTPTSAFLALSWSRFDAKGSSGSGSLQMTDTTPIDNNRYTYSGFCLSVSAGQTSHTGASFYFPAGQSHDAAFRVEVGYYSSADCSSGLIQFLSAFAQPPPTNTWFRLDAQPSVAPTRTLAALVSFKFRKTGDGGSIVAYLDGAVFEAVGGNLCYSTDGFLCLGSRFTVAAEWSTGSTSQAGRAVQLTSDTGYFWFFSPSNVEMVVKVLDACSVNGRKWVFAGGLTNVNVVLTVTDLKTGAVNIHTNPLNMAIQPIQDTNAFSTCP